MVPGEMVLYESARALHGRPSTYFHFIYFCYHIITTLSTYWQYYLLIVWIVLTFLNISAAMVGSHYDNMFIHFMPESGWDYEWFWFVRADPLPSLLYFLYWMTTPFSLSTLFFTPVFSHGTFLFPISSLLISLPISYIIVNPVYTSQLIYLPSHFLINLSSSVSSPFLIILPSPSFDDITVVILSHNLAWKDLGLFRFQTKSQLFSLIFHFNVLCGKSFIQKEKKFEIRRLGVFFDFIVRLLYFAAYSVVRTHTLAEIRGTTERIRGEKSGIMSWIRWLLIS